MSDLHPTLTAEYWRSLARDERAFAKEARQSRRAPVESILVHEENARDYDEMANRIERAQQAKVAEGQA